MVLPLMSFRFPLPSSTLLPSPRVWKAWVTYLWPNRALYPWYAVEVPVASVVAGEPSAFGSHGNLSAKPTLGIEQSVLFLAQWIATPSRLAKGLGSLVGGEPDGKTVVRSPVFSISMSAAAMAPTSQPARVKGTQ